MSTGWSGLFATAFKSSQNAMALCDDERRIIDVNGAMAQLSGYRPSQMRGTHTYDYVEGGALLSREEWRSTIARGDVTSDAEIRCADGSGMRVQFGVHPETVTGQRLVLFVALSVSRWGRHFRRSEEGGDSLGELSQREREVLGMVALGATSPEIASTLHISHNTVRKHVSNSMRKLNARSRAHLVAKALGEGHVDPQPG